MFVNDNRRMGRLRWPGALLLAAMAAAAGGCGKGEQPAPAVDEPAGENRAAAAAAAAAADELRQRAPTNAQEMALQRVQDAAFQEELKKLSAERNAKARALAAISAEMGRIEAAATNTPAMDRLRLEIEELRRTLAEKEEALAALAPHKRDPDWLKLDEKARQAQLEADAAQAAVQEVISKRMRQQYAAMRQAHGGGAGGGGRVILPMPEPPPENTNRDARLTAEASRRRPKIVVPPRPGRGLSPTNMASPGRWGAAEMDLRGIATGTNLQGRSN